MNNPATTREDEKSLISVTSMGKERFADYSHEATTFDDSILPLVSILEIVAVASTLG